MISALSPFLGSGRVFGVKVESHCLLGNMQEDDGTQVARTLDSTPKP